MEPQWHPFSGEPTESEHKTGPRPLSISPDKQEVTSRYCNAERGGFITVIEPIGNFASVRGLGGDARSPQTISDAKPDPSIIVLTVSGESQRDGDSYFGEPESSLSVKDVIKKGNSQTFKSGKKGAYPTRSSTRLKAKDEETGGRNEDTQEYQNYVAMLNLVPGPPITLKNTVNDIPSPDPAFKFISKNILDEGIREPDSEFLAGCDCWGGCEPEICGCNADYRSLGDEWVLDEKFAYDDNGRVTRPNNIGITECNMRCKCTERCQNRVVQRGRTVKLEIFMTKECGWGLRTLEPVQKGTYIDSYLGLVITRAEAERRETEYRQSGLSYLFDLDFFEKPSGTKHCGVEKPLEALGIMENPETPDADSPQARHTTPPQKKRRRATYYGGSRKRRTKMPSTGRNGRRRKMKEEVEELSEYEEIGDFKVKQEKALFGPDEGGQGSRTVARNQSVGQKSEVSAGSNLERSNSSTPVEYKMPSYSLDSKDMGNVTRFSNHSCDPNLDIYSVVTGSPEIFTLALFANRDIAAGSELTFSYSGNIGLERAQENKKKSKNKKDKDGEDIELFRCKCGTRQCVGYYWN